MYIAPSPSTRHRLLKRHPLAMCVAIATVKTSLADGIVQTVAEGRRFSEIDWHRTAVFGAFGCGYLGFALYAMKVRRLGRRLEARAWGEGGEWGSHLNGSRSPRQRSARPGIMSTPWMDVTEQQGRSGLTTSGIGSSPARSRLPLRLRRFPRRRSKGSSGCSRVLRHSATCRTGPSSATGPGCGCWRHRWRWTSRCSTHSSTGPHSTAFSRCASGGGRTTGQSTRCSRR